MAGEVPELSVLCSRVKNWALKFGVDLWEFGRQFTKMSEIQKVSTVQSTSVQLQLSECQPLGQTEHQICHSCLHPYPCLFNVHDHIFFSSFLPSLLFSPLLSRLFSSILSSPLSSLHQANVVPPRLFHDFSFQILTNSSSFHYATFR